jgi:methyl-accepting chemotaxis protein
MAINVRLKHIQKEHSRGLKISTKILILLLILGGVTIAIAFAGSQQMLAADNANAAMVKETKATVPMARANRRASEMV